MTSRCRVRRSLPWGAVLALSLAATACSGGSDDESATSSTPVGVDSPVVSAASMILEDHGEVEGFAITMIAFDSGYALTQIVENPSIELDGTLAGVAPAGEPLGLFVAAGPQGLRSTPEPSPPSDRFSVLVDLTLVEIHTSAARKLGEEVAAERAAAEQAAADEAAAAAAQAVGASVLTNVLLLIAAGYDLQQIIEGLVFGDVVLDGGVGCARLSEPPAGPALYAPLFGCDTGSADADADPATDVAPTDPPTTAPEEGDPVAIEPQQELWEGDLVPNPELIDDPVAGGFVLSRAAGTDQFEITIATTDAKTNTATTDGFDEVECSSEWSSVYEGTGTFWEINDLGIEFEGTITRDIVYVAGPCTSQVENEVSAFSGVVVFIAENGMELSFNGWSVEIPGPPPTPVDR